MLCCVTKSIVSKTTPPPFMGQSHNSGRLCGAEIARDLRARTYREVQIGCLHCSLLVSTSIGQRGVHIQRPCFHSFYYFLLLDSARAVADLNAITASVVDSQQPLQRQRKKWVRIANVQDSKESPLSCNLTEEQPVRSPNQRFLTLIWRL